MNAPTIVVGVTPWQPGSIVDEALGLATRLECRILFASVDLSRYVTETRADGSIVAASFDSDVDDVIVEEFDSGLAERLRGLAMRAQVECDFLHRPVLVVPTDPVSGDSTWPWDDEGS